VGSEEDWYLEINLDQPGIDIEDLKKSASGINKTPFVWNNGSTEYKMNLISGFAGATMT